MFFKGLVLAVCLILAPLSAHADSRYIIEGINVGAGSGLTSKFEVEFVKDQLTKVFAKGMPAGGGQRIVVVACVQPDGDLFMDSFTDSTKYSFYKVKINDAGVQALFVFGFSDGMNNTRTVNEARIIAIDSSGNIVNHRVRGFAPIAILDMPMQLNSDKELFFMEPDGAEVVFKYDAGRDDFTFTKSK